MNINKIHNYHLLLAIFFMKKLRDFLIKTQVRTQKNFVIDRHFFINQSESIRNKEKVVDCFGSNWCIIFLEKTNERKFFARSGSTFFELSSNKMIFIPPFSFFETKIPPGTRLNFTTIFSSLPLEKKYLNPLIVDKKENFKLPKTREQVLKLLEEFQNGENLLQQSKISAISEKLKKSIELHYSETITISQIAKNMKISREVLSRSFKESYHITPIEYRHCLRLFKALSLMNTNISLGEVARQVGYQDSGQFITQFRRKFDTTPKEYSPFINKRRL